MEQYLRKIRLTAEGKGGKLVVNPEDTVPIGQIRIVFTVTKGVSSTQNSANIKIYNLKESHRNAIGEELDDLTLEAGYIPPGKTKGNVGIIFKGQVRDVEHKRDGNDIITEISCGDGDKALRTATISKTLKSGSTVKEAVDEIAKALEKQGVKKGEIKLPEGDLKFKKPYSMCGSCKRELDTLSRGKDFNWSIQNGVLETTPGNGYIGGVTLLTPKTGLLAGVTITDNGVKVKALLNPEIRPNRRVKIESQELEMNAEGGEYRVSEATYNGDNYKGDFTVSITGESIKGGKVDEGKGKEKVEGKRPKTSTPAANKQSVTPGDGGSGVG
jgi:hypothetical protein